jgi:cysteinyl-tRNA synthetase
MMNQKLHIFNTESKKLEQFTPLSEGSITVYQCGPTVYWNQHIGNMRAAVIGDLVWKGLEFLYPDVRIEFVRNYTDVGHLTGDNIGDADSGVDRMQKASEREGLSPDQIADKYIVQYNNDIQSVGCRMPYMMRATEYVTDMIALVQRLLDNGHAYITPLAVYFDISTKPDYTKLSHQDIHQLMSGHGHGDVSDSGKRNSGDFALWFFRAGAHAGALQYWRSPFSSPLVDDGVGFPGWHIECSAMAMKKLGETIDIHIGGIEHIPIHHTNEIAQSESATGKQFVQYWMHHEHILIDGKKMAKSEGTSYLVSDIIERGFSPLDLRYFYLQAHYRSKQNLTWGALEAAQTARAKLIAKVAGFPDNGEVLESVVLDFSAALADDWNFPVALALVHTLVGSKEAPEHIKATVLSLDRVLGIGLVSASVEQLLDYSRLPEDIQRIIDMRVQARNDRDYGMSDVLRIRLNEAGYEIKDLPGNNYEISRA